MPHLSSEPLVWHHPATWIPILTNWLSPQLRVGAEGRLQLIDTEKWYDDDSEWTQLLASELQTEFDDVKEDLIDLLEHQIVRCYHGCRTEDAGTYFREGLHFHRREKLEARVRNLVESDARLQWMLPKLAERMAEFPSTVDEHRCFLVLDDRDMIDNAAHYLIYGSEWICSVLGYGFRAPLVEKGVPTIIEVDLPLSRTSPGLRRQLASLLLREWTRQFVRKPTEVLLQDFTFVLHEVLPAKFIMDHYHPLKMKDPLERGALYRSPRETCLYCDESDV